MPSTNRLLAEGIGTFWVVFAGCGSVVFGVSFAFGLTVVRET